MSDTDRTLVKAFLRGDDEAFRLLFRRYTPRLYALALRLAAGRAADAEEIVQECWVRAATGLGRFEWRAALSTWLSGVLVNCAREHRRRATASGELVPADIALVDRGRSTIAAIDLERAIAALPDGYREVLVLHDVEGYTHAEIATLLGVTEGTSKSQLFQARRQMRARLSSVPNEVKHHAG